MASSLMAKAPFSPTSIRMKAISKAVAMRSPAGECFYAALTRKR
jgi:hypothetical protein